MLERATAKSPGGGGRDHPLKLGPAAGSLPAPALLCLKRPSMKWLERAFAEDVGGALLAFRPIGIGLILLSWTVRAEAVPFFPFKTACSRLSSATGIAT